MNIPILHCLLSRENTEKKYFFYHGQNGILADGQTFANNNLSGFKFFFWSSILNSCGENYNTNNGKN